MPRPRTAPQTHSLRYLQAIQVCIRHVGRHRQRPRPARRIRSTRERRRRRRRRRAACRMASCVRAYARPESSARCGRATTPSLTITRHRSQSDRAGRKFDSSIALGSTPSAPSTTSSAATGPSGSCPLPLPTKLFAARYLHRACDIPKPRPTDRPRVRPVHRQVDGHRKDRVTERVCRPRRGVHGAEMEADRGLGEDCTRGHARTLKESRAFDLPR